MFLWRKWPTKAKVPRIHENHKMALFLGNLGGTEAMGHRGQSLLSSTASGQRWVAGFQQQGIRRNQGEMATSHACAPANHGVS